VAKASSGSKQTNHWIILIVVALAQFMVILDVSIVNVALPSIQHAFHMTNETLQWIVTIYTLIFGGFLLLGGRAADLFGRRKMFLIGVALFSLASLVDGLAHSGSILIISRGLQGLSGAILSPAALSIILVTYKEGHERNVALSVWGAVASGGAAAGVLLGGIITQYFGWRWNFFVNVPIGIFVFYMATRLLPSHESTVDHSDLDLFGAITATAGLITLVYALVKAPTLGWTSTTSITYFGISIILLLAFLYNESRVKHPLVPLGIFRIRNLSGANLLQLCMAAALFSVFFFTTIYLQEILGFSPIRTGLSFLIIPIIIGIAATNVPRIIQKVGYRPILIVAPLIVSAGLFWLSFIPVNGNYWTDVAPGLALLGLGMGMTFVSVTIAATSGVPKHEAGLASGILNTSQQIGGSIGLAVLTGIATSSTANYLKNQNLHMMPSQEMIAQSVVHGFQNGYLVASTFGVAASLIAVFVIHQAKVKKTHSSSEAVAIV